MNKNPNNKKKKFFKEQISHQGRNYESKSHKNSAKTNYNYEMSHENLGSV